MKVLNLPWLSCVGLPGDAQAVEIPRAEMEVVKGQIAVLHAWYSPGSDISKNSVTWQVFGNGTKPVRRHLLLSKLFPEQGLNLWIMDRPLTSESAALRLTLQAGNLTVSIKLLLC